MVAPARQERAAGGSVTPTCTTDADYMAFGWLNSGEGARAFAARLARAAAERGGEHGAKLELRRKHHRASGRAGRRKSCKVAANVTSAAANVTSAHTMQALYLPIYAISQACC